MDQSGSITTPMRSKTSYPRQPMTPPRVPVLHRTSSPAPQRKSTAVPPGNVGAPTSHVRSLWNGGVVILLIAAVYNRRREPTSARPSACDRRPKRNAQSYK